MWTEPFIILMHKRYAGKYVKHAGIKVLYILYVHTVSAGLIKRSSRKQLLLAHCINCRIRWKNWPGWFMVLFIDVIYREQGDGRLQVNPSMSTAIIWPVVTDLVPAGSQCPLPFGQHKSTPACLAVRLQSQLCTEHRLVSPEDNHALTNATNIINTGLLLYTV